MINGIVHTDYRSSRNQKVEIIEGGIGKSFVKVRMTDEVGHGMRSSIQFYYHLNNPQLGLLELDDFLETNILVNSEDTDEDTDESTDSD